METTNLGMPDLAKQRKQLEREVIGMWIARLVVWSILLVGMWVAAKL